MSRSLILVTIDSLRADHLSYFGCPDKTTPHIDDLARQATVSTVAISTGPTTSLSFPSILTSRCALSFPTTSLGAIDISSGGVTLSEILKSNSYETAAFLSYNPQISSIYGYQRGFDTFVDFIPYTDPSKKKRQTQILNSVSPLTFFRDFWNYIIKPSLHKDQIHYDQIITNKAISWIKEKRPKKFFLWLHFMDTHMPYLYSTLPPLRRMLIIQKSRKLQKACKNNKFALNPSHLVELRKLYGKSIKEIDFLIYSFMKSITNYTKLNDILLVLTADHGEEFGEHGDWGHEKKLYEELLRVPLIIFGKGIYKRKLRKPLSLSTLPSIILDLLGIPNESFPCTCSTEEGTISEFRTINKIGYAYRTEEWKLILTIHKNGKERHLYNLIEDPLEKHNKIRQRKDLADIFEKELLKHRSLENMLRREQAFLRKERRKFPSAHQPEKEEILKRLRQLGYV